VKGFFLIARLQNTSLFIGTTTKKLFSVLSIARLTALYHNCLWGSKYYCSCCLPL